jgi:hypothetical protein
MHINVLPTDPDLDSNPVQARSLRNHVPESLVNGHGTVRTRRYRRYGWVFDGPLRNGEAENRTLVWWRDLPRGNQRLSPSKCRKAAIRSRSFIAVRSRE